MFDMRKVAVNVSVPWMWCYFQRWPARPSGATTRYKAGFQTGDERKEAAGNALLAYKNAMAEAERSVPATDPLRLGVALNYAVFYYEILKSAERAKAVAQKAFDDGIASLSELEADQRAQSMQILQLLRDNLTAWHDVR